VAELDFSQPVTGRSLIATKGVGMSNAAQHHEIHQTHANEASIDLFLDICARRHARAKSRGEAPESDDALLDATLNAMPTHVAILDGHGRILLVNKSWRYFIRALGQLSPEDLTGVEYLRSGILGALDRRHAQVLRFALKALLRGEVERFQHVIHVTHTKRWYQISVARFEHGDANRVVITHEDISAIHAAQNTIKELSRRLLDLQEEERKRIALDLHDSTAQQLAAIGLSLMALRRKSSGDAETHRLFDEIEHIVGDAQKEIRSFSYLLHPPHLARDGLRMTLLRFIDGYRRRTGLQASAQITDEVDSFAAHVQRALLRIVQEALANVHRHACASEVLVKFRTTRTMLLLTVADNGKGMDEIERWDVSSPRAFGLGLPGMHARITQLGGVLKILSGTRGTTVSGKVPLVQRAG
jgi:PAS domain S-box-containing protein